jgi:hypothetical protein
MEFIKEEIMNNIHFKDEIIRKIAENTCTKVSEKVIEKLAKAKMEERKENRSPLKTHWEVICVQAQSKKTETWNSHLKTLSDLIWAEAKELSGELLDSIWLQTEEGIEWDECRSDQDAPKPSKEAIIEFILQESILPKAESCADEHVKKYLKQELDQKNIYSKKATKTCKKISTHVIRTLQKTTEGMQNVDSPLKNLWDEICVQVQGQESVMWDAYLLTIGKLILRELNSIDRNIKESIWLQTQQGMDWEDENEDKDYEEQEPMGVNDDDIVEYILQEFVLAKAADWENKRIQEYQYPPGYES